MAACVAVPSGAVAWWRGQSNSMDSVGINDGFVSARIPTSAYMTGKVGAAFHFQSVFTPFGTNYMFVPGSADLEVGAGNGLTIEAWIKPDATVGLQPIVEWNDRAGIVGAGLNLNGAALEAYLTDTNGLTHSIVVRSVAGILVTSAWQHVALTFSKSNGLATLYRDGVTVGQTNLGAFTPQTKAPLFLAFRPGLPAARTYAGGIDELTIYDRALTSAELQAIVSAGSEGKCLPGPSLCVPPPPQLVGWWRGESNVLDSVDTNHGQFLGGNAYTLGVVDNGFLFSAVSLRPYGYVRIPRSSSLNVGVAPGLTVEMWILPELDGFGKIAQELVSWSGGIGIPTQGVSLVITNTITTMFPPVSTSYLQANLIDTLGRAHLVRYPLDPAMSGAWQYVALTYDKATGLAVLYWNGNPVTQTNLGSFTPQTDADFNFGFYLPPSEPFPFPRLGPSLAMDEVSLYARALSSAEIRSLRLSRNAGKCKEPPSIISAPVNLRANQGANATFLVVAAGNPLLKYQWRRNGTNLPGATGASLILTNVQLAHAGNYSVRVTNAFGVAVSTNALLTINRPPMADPTATAPLAIAPLGCSPKIILDGSRSSDPDADPLNYYWFNAGESTAFATGAVAIVSLPTGTNWLRLVVDDGAASSARDFQVIVDSVWQAVERLKDGVLARVPKPNPLAVSLAAAMASIERGNVTAAINQLQAFEQKLAARLESQSPGLDPQLAASARTIIDILENGCLTVAPHRRDIEKINREPNGNLKLQFNAPHGPLYVIEASTNLVDWEKIGIATHPRSDEFEYEDRSASPYRFYRVTVP